MVKYPSCTSATLCVCVCVCTLRGGGSTACQNSITVPSFDSAEEDTHRLIAKMSNCRTKRIKSWRERGDSGHFFFFLVSFLVSSPPNTSQEPTGGRVYKRWDGEGEGGTLRKGNTVRVNKRAEHVIGTEYEREGRVEISCCHTFIYFLVALSPLQTNYRGCSAEVTWGHRWGLFFYAE